MKSIKNCLLSRFCSAIQIRMATPIDKIENNKSPFFSDQNCVSISPPQNLPAESETKKITFGTIVIAFFLKLLIPPTNINKEPQEESAMKMHSGIPVHKQ